MCKLIPRDIVTKGINLTVAQVIEAFANNDEHEQLTSAIFTGILPTDDMEIEFIYTVRRYDSFLEQDAVETAYLSYDFPNERFVAQF